MKQNCAVYEMGALSNMAAIYLKTFGYIYMYIFFLFL